MPIEHRCPKCGCESLYATVTVRVDVIQYSGGEKSTRMDFDDDRFYPEPDTRMSCLACGHKGCAPDFKVQVKITEANRAAVIHFLAVKETAKASDSDWEHAYYCQQQLHITKLPDTELLRMLKAYNQPLSEL